MRFISIALAVTINTLLLFGSCSANGSRSNVDSIVQTPVSNHSELSVENDSVVVDSHCDSLLLVLIKSSNFSYLKDFKYPVHFNVDDASSEVIKIRSYTISDLNMRMTLGWIVIDLNKQQLLDITNDPEQPIKLNFAEDAFSNFKKCWSSVGQEEYNVPDEDH